MRRMKEIVSDDVVRDFIKKYDAIVLNLRPTDNVHTIRIPGRPWPQPLCCSQRVEALIKRTARKVKLEELI